MHKFDKHHQTTKCRAINVYKLIIVSIKSTKQYVLINYISQKEIKTTISDKRYMKMYNLQLKTCI